MKKRKIVYRRIFDLLGKGWKYFLADLERPGRIFFILTQVFLKKVDVGELVRILHYEKWFKRASIQTLIDAGAHQGGFASAMNALEPNIKIYSFEPLPDSYKKLCDRFSNKKDFKGFCVALGDRNEKVNFFKNYFSKSSSLLEMDNLHKQVFPWTRESESITVQMKTLDDYLDIFNLESNIFLKIDVQGFEGKLLKGADKILNHIDYILVETSFHSLYKGQPLFDEINILLGKKGFIFSGFFDQSYSRSTGDILYADALFVRAEKGKSS